MKTKIIAVLLAVVTILSLSSMSAAAYNSDIQSSITQDYKKALSLAHRRSFNGQCNLATAYQLYARGIYKDGLDYSGTGNTWYHHFRNEKETSGGYSVITVSGANCLYDLVKKYGNELYNIVYSLGTGGTSGDCHVLYIRAIINGYVYFADSFGTTYNHKYYNEGAGTVLPLSKFVSEYKRMNGNAFGCVYFTSNGTEHLYGSSDNPSSWENQSGAYSTGKYTVTSSMIRVREKAKSDSDTLGYLSADTTVSVTEIKENWGRIAYEGKTGWICLDYTVQLYSDADIMKELASTAVTADKSVAFRGDSITWTATAKNTGAKYFYAFYIYRNNTKIYSGTLNSANTFSLHTDLAGNYKAVVEISDGNNHVVTISGPEVFCIDRNSVSAGTQAASAMMHITGKDFISLDVTPDGRLVRALKLDETDEEEEIA